MDPNTVEAGAALHVVLFIKEEGFFYIILTFWKACFANSQQLNSNFSLCSRFGHLLDGIKTELQSFWSSSIVHMKRERNSASHVLTKAFVTHVINFIWLEEISPNIYDIVCKEMVVPSSILTFHFFFLRLLMRIVFLL